MSGIVTSIEMSEYFYPVLHLYYRRLEDSGGPGMFRGGVGVEAALTPHDAPKPFTINIFGWGVQSPASAGMYGGYVGSTYQSAIKRNTDVEELFRNGVVPGSLGELHGKLEIPPIMCTTQLRQGDILAGSTTGGGGYGDPLDRDSTLVVQDVVDHLVSLKCASKVYGVTLTPDLKLMNVQTNQRRKRIIRQRLAGIINPPVTDNNVGSKAGQVKPASEYLEIVTSKSGVVIKCRKCKHVFCTSEFNYKEYALEKEFPVSRAGPQINPYKIANKFELREFYCPGCGVLLEVEINVKGDPYVWDLQLDA
jgi:N-methylhydantoinase B